MNDLHIKTSLPNDEYIYLLGVSLSIFSSLFSFIVENILYTDTTVNWYELIDEEAGREIIIKKIEDNLGLDIKDSYKDIVDMRNRIVRGFRITSKSGEQILGTKTRQKNHYGQQFEITTDYLIDFINKTDALMLQLNNYRKGILNG